MPASFPSPPPATTDLLRLQSQAEENASLAGQVVQDLQRLTEDVEDEFIQNTPAGAGDGDGLVAEGGGVDLPFAYVGTDPASAPANDVALLNVGWVRLSTPTAEALIGTPNAADDGTTDADSSADTSKTDAVTLEEGDNFIVAHLTRAATVAASTLVLERYDSFAAIPANTNSHYYYLLALVTLTTTDGKGVQKLIRQYWAGVKDWVPSAHVLNYCNGGESIDYDIPSYNPADAT